MTVIDTRPRTIMNSSPIEIIVESIEGALFEDGVGLTTAYENTNITIKGKLAVEDRQFSVPIRRDDGRLFLFLAEVINGEFTMLVNFPTVGKFTYSNNECNIDLPTNVFRVKTMKFDVLRKIT